MQKQRRGLLSPLKIRALMREYNDILGVNMPAKRKTAAELALSGALKAKPGRYKNRGAAVPAENPLGNAPRHLSASQKIIWRLIVSIAPEGLLSRADTFAVELCVKMIERSRTVAGTRASEIACLMNMLGKLGLTPIDRERLDIPTVQPSKADDPWEAF